MKKVALIVTGCLLFVAGYYHVQRQAQFTAARKNPVNARLVSTPLNSTTPVKAKPAFILSVSKHFALN